VRCVSAGLSPPTWMRACPRPSCGRPQGTNNRSAGSQFCFSTNPGLTRRSYVSKGSSAAGVDRSLVGTCLSSGRCRTPSRQLEIVRGSLPGAYPPTDGGLAGEQHASLGAVERTRRGEGVGSLDPRPRAFRVETGRVGAAADGSLDARRSCRPQCVIASRRAAWATESTPVPMWLVTRPGQMPWITKLLAPVSAEVGSGPLVGCTISSSSVRTVVHEVGLGVSSRFSALSRVEPEACCHAAGVNRQFGEHPAASERSTVVPCWGPASKTASETLARSEGQYVRRIAAAARPG
jgi:hypothetical protein